MFEFINTMNMNRYRQESQLADLTALVNEIDLYIDLQTKEVLNCSDIKNALLNWDTRMTLIDKGRKDPITSHLDVKINILREFNPECELNEME